MSVAGFLGWAAAVASILGLAIALYSLRRDRRPGKRLVFDTHEGLPLAESRDLGDYRLQVLFEAEGEPKAVDSARVHYLSFANLGEESIRRDDIAPANPLRLEVEGAEVLSVDLESETRDVCRVSVEFPVEKQEETAPTHFPVAFDFLDTGDGGLVRVLTDGRPERIRLAGDIIGMPRGLTRLSQLTDLSRARRALRAFLIALGFLLPQVSIVVLFSRTFGFDRSWWLILPVVGLVASVVIALAVESAVTPGLPGKFPQSLRPRLGLRGMAMSGDGYVIVHHGELRDPRHRPSRNEDT